MPEEDNMREYTTLKRLRAGEVIEIEGVQVRMVEGEILPGDWYVGERNAGPKLLTAFVLAKDPPDIYIIPRENAYAYDIGECVKVTLTE